MTGLPVLKKLFTIALLSLATVSSAHALNINTSFPPITEIVTVQPIIVSDDDGSNTATFFGTVAQQIAIEFRIDQIWNQAGIDVNFLTPNTWSDTFANTGDQANNVTRRTSDLYTVVDTNGPLAGVNHADPLVINMFFVNKSAGWEVLASNWVAGYAKIGGNGVTQYVGSSLVSWSGGQDLVATIVSHEIGHNLGLPHTNSLGYTTGTDNLMWSSGGGTNRTGQQFDAAQIATALGSNLSVSAVPVPTAIWFMISGLAALFGMKRKSTLSA